MGVSSSFGDVVSGGEVTQTVTVSNLGSAGDPNITLDPASITGTHAAEFSAGLINSTTLTPGESVDVSITHTASDTLGTKTATLEITHTGTNTPTLIDLSATTSATTIEDPTPREVTEDFTDPASIDQFEFGVYHRDNVIVSQTQWPGDHDMDCGTPDTHRTIHRDTPSESFYHCRGHVMTSVGDTSGYSIAAFTPANVFTDIREVRWDVNITDLGSRQWTEVKIIPTNAFDFDNIPCSHSPSTPCNTDNHDVLGSVGTTFKNAVMHIHNGDTLHRWNGNGNWDKYFRYPDDPARDSIRIRRQHFFRDNGNNTLTFGIETETGAFKELTVPGSFPTGDVRVAFADHGYTPNKAGTPISYTWHWDNLSIKG